MRFMDQCRQCGKIYANHHPEGYRPFCCLGCEFYWNQETDMGSDRHMEAQEPAVNYAKGHTDGYNAAITDVSKVILDKITTERLAVGTAFSLGEIAGLIERLRKR